MFTPELPAEGRKAQLSPLVQNGRKPDIASNCGEWWKIAKPTLNR